MEKFAFTKHMLRKERFDNSFYCQILLSNVADHECTKHVSCEFFPTKHALPVTDFSFIIGCIEQLNHGVPYTLSSNTKSFSLC